MPRYDVVAPYSARGDGTTDDTVSIQNAITACNTAGGGEVFFAQGTYKISSTITVGANTALIFDGCTIKAAAAFSTGIFAWTGTHVRAEGRLTYDANGFATPCFAPTSGGDYSDFDLHATYQGAPSSPSINNYFIKTTQVNHVRVAGRIVGTKPWAISIDRGSHHEVSGVNVGPMTVTNGSFGVISVMDLAGGTAMTDISVHDCHVDGGGVQAGYAGITIGQSIGGSTHVSYVKVARCSVINTASGADGIDFVQCDQVACSDCHVNATNNGIDVAGCNYVETTNCSAVNCRSAGFQIGDVTVAFSTNICTYSNCIAIACGIGGQTDFTAAGFVVFAPAASSTNLVTLKNCISYNAGNGAMKYGFGFGNGASGTFSNIFVEGGFALGGTAAYLDSATVKPAALMKNVAGLNPQGTAVTTPGFPATTVNVTNTTGFDVLATVVNGTGAMTNISIGNQTITGSLPASATLSFIVPAGFQVKFTYPSGAPSWVWYGL